MLSPATREAQATACLEAAAQHREPLLALARRLTGCPEEGMNLYQQMVLNCHDAIQRNGFAGEHYEFYLFSSLRNLYWREAKRSQREVPYDFQQQESGSASRDDERSAPWAAQIRRQQTAATVSPAAELAPLVDAHADLAEQVRQEVRTRFALPDRLALHLHAEGYAYQAIAEMLGLEGKQQVWRRIERIRQTIGQQFARAWRALHEPD